MITMGFFVQHLALGLAISAADAPATILCIKKALKQGVASGVLVGLGTSVAYLVFSILAGFGVVNLIVVYGGQAYAEFMGAVFLFWLGVMTIKTLPLGIKERRTKAIETNFYSFLSAFFFTIANPVSIIIFIILSQSIGETGINVQYSSITLTPLGVFLGSSAWWLVISSITGRIGTSLSSQTVVFLNRVAGVSLVLFGCYMCVNAYQHI